MRPVVAFDVTNRKHREDYARFIATGSWGHCPVRYELDDVSGELQATIQRVILEYYMKKEFKIEVDNR
jgi:hypothetical protein